MTMDSEDRDAHLKLLDGCTGPHASLRYQPGARSEAELAAIRAIEDGRRHINAARSAKSTP